MTGKGASENQSVFLTSSATVKGKKAPQVGDLLAVPEVGNLAVAGVICTMSGTRRSPALLVLRLGKDGSAPLDPEWRTLTFFEAAQMRLSRAKKRGECFFVFSFLPRFDDHLFIGDCLQPPPAISSRLHEGSRGPSPRRGTPSGGGGRGRPGPPATSRVRFGVIVESLISSLQDPSRKSSGSR
jgi:hypothetical protein